MTRIALVGCVKTKNDMPMAAKDLYTSNLFRERRRWAETKADRWFILSAKFGLVDPDDLIPPYNETLHSSVRARIWSSDIKVDLIDALGNLRGVTFEIHAGAPYYEHLKPMLEALGARVSVPLQHVSGTGTQVAWYRKRL
jgi:hypothetical protein